MGGRGGKLQNHGEQCRNKGAEGKVERFPHRGPAPTSIHQPEMLLCSPAGVGGGWELRLHLWRSDPRERTGVGFVNTAGRGLVRHTSREGVREKVWSCLRVKRPLFRGARGEEIQNTT